MSKEKQSSILIVGGGSSGLVLGLTLVKHGVSVRIIEKAPGKRIGERGSAVMPRTLELYGFLGIMDEIGQIAHEVPPMLFYAPDGRSVGKIVIMSPHEEPSSAKPYPNMFFIGQDHQENILQAHLEKHGGKIEFQTELVSITELQDHSAVAVTLKKTLGDGTVEEEKTQFDYVVGADGAHSLVRKSLKEISFLGETVDRENIVVGDFLMDPEVPLDTLHWHCWGEPRTRMVSLRAGNGKKNTYTFLSMGLEFDHEHMASSREALIETFYEVSGRTDIKFGDMIWLKNWRPNIRMADRFSVGRILLVGDAAHVNSPTGGQGMNSSIQDSFNLGWKLALVAQGYAPPSLLNSYNQERIPIIAEMLLRTTEMLKGTFTTFRKDGTDNSAWDRGGETLMLGINCRGSPIVVDGLENGEAFKGTEGASEAMVNVERHKAYQGAKGIQAGDRAPDAASLVPIDSLEKADKISNPSPQRLFSIYSPTRHTVLVFLTDLTLATIDAATEVPKLLKARLPSGKLFKTVLIISSKGEHEHAAFPEWKSIGFDYAFRDQTGDAFNHYGVPQEKALDQVTGISRVIVVRPDMAIGAMLPGLDGVNKYLDGVFAK